MGIADQTLHNWLKIEELGGLEEIACKSASAEQMEIGSLRAELARVKMGCAYRTPRQVQSMMEASGFHFINADRVTNPHNAPKATDDVVIFTTRV